jgi:C-methyltransferase C-terminal domain/Putative zinc binding domain/Methyltransferase domain
MRCRHCAAELSLPFVDLGASPPSNAYLTAAALSAPEKYYPLRVMVCTSCWLVQTEDAASAGELFSHDYAYFSSVSQSWLDHAARYAQMITQRLSLGKESLVIEVAANDGYLLKNFVAAGIPCLGIEPTASTAEAAEGLGIPIRREFFGKTFAESLRTAGQQADLIVGNNVFAHVPDINDFTDGLKIALKPSGTITLEFPHVMRLIEHAQFDTIYHEHFSYLSLRAVCSIFSRAGLRIWDVEELGTHGGSLRVFGCHAGDHRSSSPAVAAILDAETQRGLGDLDTYRKFQSRADRLKNDFLSFLIEKKRGNKSIAAYGAAAKGNTLLNYAGVKPDLLPYVCDAALSKQGKYMPGSRIPIMPPDVLLERRPEYIVVLPWNIADEVIAQHSYVREWGGKFVVAAPVLSELP